MIHIQRVPGQRRQSPSEERLCRMSAKETYEEGRPQLSKSGEAKGVTMSLRRQDYDYLIKLLLIGDSGGFCLPEKFFLTAM